MRSQARNAILLGVTALTLALVGCGDSSGRIPIKGTVHYQGKPVAKGTIMFFPKENVGHTTEAAPITDGHYATANNKGLLPGHYRVEITAVDEKGSEVNPNPAPGAPKHSRKQLLPEQYNKKSTLGIDVTESGTREFPFDLK